jgi:hypothetical protein
VRRKLGSTTTSRQSGIRVDTTVPPVTFTPLALETEPATVNREPPAGLNPMSMASHRDVDETSQGGEPESVDRPECFANGRLEVFISCHIYPARIYRMLPCPPCARLGTTIGG